MNNNAENPHMLSLVDPHEADDDADRRRAHRQLVVLVVLVGLAVLLAAAWFVVPVLSDSGSPTRADTSHGQDAARGTTVQDVRNGEIPSVDLVAIGDGYFLTAPAAHAYQKLTAALQSAGYDFTLNSAYRSREEQESLVEKYGLLEDGGRAAPVGESEHGRGTAVDLKMSYDAVDWLREHAAAYGFAETISGEPWHWAYVG